MNTGIEKLNRYSKATVVKPDTELLVLLVYPGTQDKLITFQKRVSKTASVVHYSLNKIKIQSVPFVTPLHLSFAWEKENTYVNIIEKIPKPSRKVFE